MPSFGTEHRRENWTDKKGPALVAKVVRLRQDQNDAAGEALAALGRHLDRADLKPHTRRAYRRQAAGYVDWLAKNAGMYPDAFADEVGANAAIGEWKRHLLGESKLGASTINQA